MRSSARFVVAGLAAVFCGASAAAMPFKVQAIERLEGHTAGAVGVKITDAGQVFGFGQMADGVRTQFWWQADQRRGLPPGLTAGGPQPLEHYPVAYAKNRSGLYAGARQRLLNSPLSAFVWSTDHGMEYLGSLGGEGSGAFDLNDDGGVVGWSETDIVLPDESREVGAFVWRSETGMQGLQHLPGYTHAVAAGINNHGAIVGVATNDRTTATHWPILHNRLPQDSVGVIWLHGQAIDLNMMVLDEGWIIEAAFDINNLGQITGMGLSPKGDRVAVILHPLGESEVDEETLVDDAPVIISIFGLPREVFCPKW